MDPLTALGLAGNIITFIDFTTKLCKTTIEVYEASENDASGKPSSARQRLEAQLKYFIITTSKVAEAAQKKSTPITFEINEAVLDTNLQHFVGYSKTLSQSGGLCKAPNVPATTVESVAEASNLIAQQMIDRLESMRKTAKGKIWRSLKLAVRDLLKESEVKEMQETLNMYQQNLIESLDLQHTRQQDQFDSFKTSMRDTLEELMERNMAFPPKNSKGGGKVTFSSTSPSSVSRIQYMPEASERSNEQQRKESEVIKRCINEALDARGLKRLPDLSVLSQPNVVSNAATKLSADLLSQERELLLSLKFPAMEDREEDVSEVKVSFDWIFHDPEPGDQPWDNFFQWLSGSTDPLYWITGKAGSGKSTLMKHVYHEPRTRQALLQWASPDPVAVAAFFFWRTGSPLQKTEEGLLRSLLYQVLYTHRELIPIIFPSSDSAHTVAWTIHTLRRVFQALIRQKDVVLKICFFIDGLDEYAGGHMDIAKLVNDVANVDNIKICASSRPLPDFEFSFQRRPSLMLQNLTFNDIQTYVTTKFNENLHVAHIQKSDPDLSEQLSREIVDRASGVFLWVKLAVESILKGLRNEDNSSELYTRLRKLPTDLMELYSHMLRSVDPEYEERGTEFLQMVYRARKPFPILELAFADLLLNEPTNASETALGHLSKEKRQEKCIRMETRLKVACLGLVEVTPAHSDTYIGNTERPVQFMHQSVADFLETELARRHMEKTTSHPFSPYLTLMEASLFSLKYLDTDLLPVRQPTTYLAEVWYASAWCIIWAFMSYAAVEERMQKQAQVQLVDRMDSEAERLAKLCLQLDKRTDIAPNVAAQLHWSERRREQFHKVQLNGSIVSFALEFGLHFYAAAKLKSGNSIKQGRRMTSKQAKFALAVEQAYSSRREVPSDLRERVRNKLDSAARFRINDWSFGLWNRKLETSKDISQAVDQLGRFKDDTEKESAEIVSQTAFPDIGGDSARV